MNISIWPIMVGAAAFKFWACTDRRKCIVGHCQPPCRVSCILHRRRGYFSIPLNHTSWDDYANAVHKHIINIELQIVVVLFGRDLPVERSCFMTIDKNDSPEL
jgi:hypothetical protein